MSVLPTKTNQTDANTSKLPSSCCWKYNFTHNEFYFNKDFVDHFGLKNQNFTSLDVWENILTAASYQDIISFFKEPTSANGKKTFFCNSVKYPNQSFTIEIRAIDMVNPTTPGNMICRVVFNAVEKSSENSMISENNSIVQGVYKRFFYNSKQPVIIIEKDGAVIKMNDSAKGIFNFVMGADLKNMKDILTYPSIRDLEGNLKKEAQFLLKLKFIEKLKTLNDTNWHVHPSLNFCYMIGE